MKEVYLPTFHTLAMNNIFTGSYGALRFRVQPCVVKVEGNDKEINFAESSLSAEFWHGELCYEKSTMEGKQSFPLTEEGLLAIKQWLESNI